MERTERGWIYSGSSKNYSFRRNTLVSHAGRGIVISTLGQPIRESAYAEIHDNVWFETLFYSGAITESYGYTPDYTRIEIPDVAVKQQITERPLRDSMLRFRNANTMHERAVEYVMKCFNEIWMRTHHYDSEFRRNIGAAVITVKEDENETNESV